ncbi:hypothetical protein ACFQ1S_35960, partial [Kibdelosporangium lantanae]
MHAVNLTRFNAAPADDLRPLLRNCLAVPRWVDTVLTSRPYDSREALLTAAGAGLTVFMTASWELVLFWGIFVGLGTGSMAMAFVALDGGDNYWHENQKGDNSMAMLMEEVPQWLRARGPPEEEHNLASCARARDRGSRVEAGQVDGVHRATLA